MRRKIKLDLSGITAAKLIERIGTVVTKMTGNAHFPSPTPTLAELTDAMVALTSATVAASGRDRDAVLIRKQHELVVANLLRNLAGYITMTANGDGAIIASSGFELAKIPEPQPALSRPENFKARRGANTGEVEVSWRSVRNALNYEVEMTNGDPAIPTTEWEHVRTTAQVKVLFTGLGIGNFFSYRVKAVGRHGESPYSDVSVVMTAAA